MKSYLTTCKQCGRTTSKAYARKNNGACKACVTGIAPKQTGMSRAERENALLIDSGYQAYARERGDYDLPDNY